MKLFRVGFQIKLQLKAKIRVRVRARVRVGVTKQNNVRVKSRSAEFCKSCFLLWRLCDFTSSLPASDVMCVEMARIKCSAPKPSLDGRQAAHATAPSTYLSAPLRSILFRSAFVPFYSDLIHSVPAPFEF